VPIVRVPWNEPGIIMKSLDAGAYGVIVPMVNSRAEAEAAVSTADTRRRVRSYGPARVVLYAGRDYFQHANETVLCIVMIETAQAIENLDDILSVPGVDVVYIGPADLSVSLGFPPASYHEDPKYAGAVQAVVDACRRHGVVSGFHGGNPANACPHRPGLPFRRSLRRHRRWRAAAADPPLLGQPGMRPNPFLRRCDFEPT
jgi:4-hydroxy-2-oxoheptanedioate aldolase